MTAEPGQQIETSLKINEETSVPYLQYLPKGYDPSDKTKKWPLMLFLHGRGESNGPLSIVKNWGPPRLIDQGKDFPYIIISPQCPKTSSWHKDDQQHILLKLLDHVQQTFSIDSSRIYLTGLSMGGYGSWELATRKPETFAAVIPICGGGTPKKAAKLINLPIWAWHGTADDVIPFKESVDMVQAIQKAGGKKITFSQLEEVGHNSWDTAYGDPKVWEWLAQQKR